MPPKYDYTCENKGCKHNKEEFEVEQKITDEPLTKCPRCGRKVKRLIGRVTIKYQGTGWTPKFHK